MNAYDLPESPKTLLVSSNLRNTMNAYDLPESPKTLLVSSSIQPIYFEIH